MGKLFGTNGVRGVVGTDMTPELALRLGRAVGSWLPGGSKVAVARDARGSGPMLRDAFSAGLRATGCHAVDIGILPSPAAQLYVRDRGFAAGAIVTASHNPPEYNGIKLVAPDGTETDVRQEAEVEAIVERGAFRNVPWDQVGSLATDGGAVRHYLDAIKGQVDVQAIRKAGLRAVLDPGGGAGCVAAPVLLAELGVDVVPLSCDLDGAFRDRPSEPSPKNAARCIEKVKATHADLGILQDGDADRAVFVDENGQYVWGDTALAMAASWELRRHPPGKRIACTAISTSTCMADAVAAAGGKLVWTAVGSPIVAREMIARGAAFGGEDNGGLMFARHQVCRDGLMAVAFVLEVLATTGKPLSQLTAEVPRYALWKDKIDVPDAEKAPLLERIRAGAQGLAGVREVDARDGVKAYLDGGWVLVRPSGTEPIYRIQAEGKTEAEAKASVERFKQWVGTLRAR